MVELLYSGKVRDLYSDGEDLIMVASDRVSVYDVVLPTPVPDKGRVLTQLSLWWFGQLTGLITNHVLSGTDVPAQWAGRAIRCRRLRMLPVECIARGYLAGLGLVSYNETGTICGVRLPPGLGEGSRLPGPRRRGSAGAGRPAGGGVGGGRGGGVRGGRGTGRLARHRYRRHQAGVR